MPTITLVREGRTLEVPENANLREVLLVNGVDVYRAPDDLLNCRGRGLCGTCLVEVEPAAAVTGVTFREKARLWQYEGRPMRLSCQAKVVADCRILTRPQLAQGWMAHPFYSHLKEDVKAGPAKEKAFPRGSD
jgi:ferredoxin